MVFLELAILSLFASVLYTEEALVVHIDGDKGRDDVNCLNQSFSESCQSLEFVADHLTQKEFVEIEIESGALNLTGPVEFTDFSHLTISGHSVMTNISCNQSGAGLAFVGVQNLTLDSLIIKRCGAERDSTSVDPQTPNVTECLRVAVYVLNCTNVSINRVDIQFSNGTGLSLYDTNGTVDISDSNFTDNTLGENAFEPGGGGLRIEFTICTPGIVGNCSGAVNSSNYIIDNCNFSRNKVYCPPHRQRYISPFTNAVTPRLGRGGGIYLSIGSNAASNSFTISGCTFENNSASFGGGGMVVEFINSVQKNTVSVTGSILVKNSCLKDERDLCSGGGLVIDAMFYDFSGNEAKFPKDNIFLCTNSSFSENVANIGGGMGIYITKNTKSPQNLTNISFSNCSWSGNKAPMGAAAFISPGVWDYTRDGFVPSPLFTDCTFESNSAVQKLSSSQRKIYPSNNGAKFKILSMGYGALFISEFKVKFKGKTVFANNKGSAVRLSNSVLAFRENSQVEFRNNVAHNGGAIGMFGASMLQIQNHSNFYFINNSAFFKGGAIYVDFNAGIEPVYHNCFVSSSNYIKTNSTSLHFKGNKANSSGTAIFTTTFQPCQLLCSTINMTQLRCPKKILDCIADFSIVNLTDDCSHPNKSDVPILATRPKQFELNEDTPVGIIPGKEYQLDIIVSDEAGTNLSQIVYEASIQPQGISINQAFEQVSNNTISLLGHTGQTGNLTLFSSDTLVVFEVTLAECPPGYGYNWQKKMCECRASKYLGLMGCVPAVYIKQGYWMGPCSKKNKTKFCTTTCPDGFCSYHDNRHHSEHHPLKNKSSELDSSLCGPTRTGRMCGRCTPGHSVYFNSRTFSCGPEHLCKYGWFFYIISEIFPLTLLFLIILFFNISFTSGNVNCFILYAQILHPISFSGNKNIQLPPLLDNIQDIVTLVYNPFSLNFFTAEKLSFCLWNGANFADVMIMKYVTVCVALVLVLLTILIARHGYLRKKLFNKFQTSDSVLIHGLSAFFVLCYAQSVRVTAHFLDFICLYSENFVCERYAVVRMGEMNYFRGDHVKYAVIAIFVFVFMIAIPPLLLIAYPLVFRLLGLCKLSESKLANVLWRLMPIQFLDAFQSSFKDNYRLFAGLYFLYRTVILGISVFSQSMLQFYSIAQLQLIIALTVQAIFQPHKEKRHNIIDTLLFANLATINMITFYYYATKDFSELKSSQVMITVLAVVQAVLILLPLLCIILHAVRWRWWCRKVDNLRDLPSLRSSSEHDSLLKW